MSQFIPPTVYQYPPDGRPDHGLEVYVWPNGDRDAYLDGRGLHFGTDSFGNLQFHLSPDIRFDLDKNQFFICAKKGD
jgi:hypothetical protein